MFNSDNRLTKILYIENELSVDESSLFFNKWIKDIITCNSCLEFLSFSNYSDFYTQMTTNQKYAHSLSESALLISTTNKSIALAKTLNIACMGFVPKRDKFLNVSYVIEGFDDLDFKYLDMVFCRFHNIPLIILETQRCIIRELALSDIDDLFSLYSDTQLTKYVEPLFDYDQEIEYQTNYIKYMYEYYGYGMWLVFDKISNKLIGRAGIEHTNTDDNNISRPNATVELTLGYLISQEYQGKGIAFEICSAIISYVKNNLDFDTISCYIDDNNYASIALATKLGFSAQTNNNCNNENSNNENSNNENSCNNTINTNNNIAPNLNSLRKYSLNLSL